MDFVIAAHIYPSGKLAPGKLVFDDPVFVFVNKREHQSTVSSKFQIIKILSIFISIPIFYHLKHFRWTLAKRASEENDSQLLAFSCEVFRHQLDEDAKQIESLNLALKDTAVRQTENVCLCVALKIIGLVD